MKSETSPLLAVEKLSVTFNTPDGAVQAVRDVTFSVAPGEVVAIVGESGCGKSVTCQAIMGLNPPVPFTSTDGEIYLETTEVTKLPEKRFEQMRGAKMAMIFQDPMTSLNPTMPIGKQVMEGIALHRRCGKSEARKRAIAVLEKVGIGDAEARFYQYPHEFSGGMRQRVMIAIALACDPALLIADEPTTALDVTIQAQILNLLRKLQRETKTSIILVTHDLGVVAGFADKVIVMYAGKIVETGSAATLLRAPQHPYTRALLQAVPRLGQDRSRPLATIAGRPPSLIDPPSGCPFWPRCPHAMKVCQGAMPDISAISSDHHVSCWLQHPLAAAPEVPHG